MIDLTTYSQDEVIAKGQYSIVRAAHEKAKKDLAILCGQFTAITPQVLRLAQPDGDMVPNVAVIAGMFVQARVVLDKMEALVTEIEGLAAQRAALKQSAWG